MISTAPNEPRATIVMTARERHSLTVPAIESVAANTARPFRFVYADCGAPEWLRESLAANAARWGLEVVRFDEPLWPHEARTRLAGSIATPYAVFIDNDVDVETGWLDALVACADATGAGVVGPLYLIGDGIRPAVIHMAGGKLVEAVEAGGRVLDERHLLANRDPLEVTDALRRAPCDFVEYHCMLVRTDLLHAVLDPRIRCVHEHIDTSLAAQKLGYATLTEPASRVTYLGGADYMLDDLPFFRARWERADVQASVHVFSGKWGVLEDERSFGCTWEFARHHVAQVDPIRPDLHDRPEHRAEMAAAELPQTRSSLLDLARERGYARDELATIAQAYGVTHTLMDGGYRPCGRPFVNHAVGTAGVLVRYGFRAEVVAAGLLHAAYTHCRVDAAGVHAVVEGVCRMLGGRDNAIERRVRAYTVRGQWLSGAAVGDASTLSVSEGEVVAMVAANELDMYMSGEIRYCGRTDVIPAAVTAAIGAVCATLGVPGLHRTLLREQAREAAVPREWQTGLRESYRIDPVRRAPVTMAVNVPAILP